MPNSLATWYLPPGLSWPQADRLFGATRLSTLEVEPTALGELAARLAHSAERLQAIPSAEIVAALDRTARLWGDPAYPPRQALGMLLPALTGYSLPMLEHTLDQMLSAWHAPQLWQRLNAELVNPAVLDAWQPYGAGHTRAFGPRLTVHVGAGNIPGVALQSLVDALLVKSPSLVKPASAEPLWAAAWVRTLVDQLPALAESLAVIWWPGGAVELEAAALAHAAALIANASNSTINDLRRRLPPEVRLLAYGSRISFAAVARDTSVADLPTLARQLAYDVAVFDQQGCVSPHMLFLEHGGPAPDELAQALDLALAALDRELPPAALQSDQVRALRQFQDELEWRGLAGDSVKWHGVPEGRWRIVIDPDARFGPGLGLRTVVIRPVADLAELPGLLAGHRAYLQSAALVAPSPRREALALLLAQAGVSRIVAPGHQPWPAVTWHHDGRQPLTALLRWTDLE